MRRRSSTGGEPIKARRRKTVTLKRGIAPKALRRRSSSAGGQETKVARLTRELNEAVEQQTATAEILSVISSSPGDLQPVFEAILQNATRICEATYGAMWLREGDGFRNAAFHGALPEAYTGQWRSGMVIPPGPHATLARIARSRKPLHVADLRKDRAYLDGHALTVTAVDLAGLRTVLGVPMLKNNELIGAFSIYRQEVRPFTDKQIALVTNFAAQAVIAIENARLLNELRQSLEQQTATAEVLKVVSSSPGDLEPVFATMLEKAVSICDAKYGNIYRWDGEFLHLLAAHDTPPALAEFRRRSALRPSLINRMVETKTAIHVIDVAADPDYLERRSPSTVAAVELGGVRSFLSVPMLKENELIGSFSLYRQEVRPFTDKQIALVTSFAAQAVIAIENARLLNELRQRTDDLTESLEQQTATSKVLDVISRSAFDLHAVFETVAESSVRLCGADRAFIYRFDTELLRMVVAYNTSREFPRPARSMCFTTSARSFACMPPMA